jgi:hypothetical protein
MVIRKVGSRDSGDATQVKYEQDVDDSKYRTLIKIQF